MKFKVLILFFAFSLLTACSNSANLVVYEESETIYPKHEVEIQEWLEEDDGDPLKLYGISDSKDKYSYVYAFSDVFSTVVVEQRDDQLVFIFKDKKANDSEPNAFKSVKYLSEKINVIITEDE